MQVPWSLLAWVDAEASAGTLDEFVFGARYLWPALAAVPLVAAGFVWASRARRRAMTGLGNPSLVARLTSSVNQGNRVVAAVLVTLAVGLLGLALMRPQYGGTAKIVPASGLDVVLAVDYSKSMLAQDVYPSRSERLEAELARFLDDASARGDRVGVVVFAGNARGFPLTRDARMLKLYLDRADPRSENPGGTAIGKALDLSLAFLVDARRGEEDAVGGDEGSPVPDGTPPPPAETDQAIILLTDGEDTASTPMKMAEKAASLGVQIYSVGIGSKSGEPIQKFDEEGNPAGFVTDEEGNYVMTRLDEELLENLAQATGGRYVHVDPEQFGLDEVRTMLEDLSRTQREDTIDIQREEGFWALLIPALLALCIAMALPDRRRAA